MKFGNPISISDPFGVSLTSVVPPFAISMLSQEKHFLRKFCKMCIRDSRQPVPEPCAHARGGRTGGGKIRRAVPAQGLFAPLPRGAGQGA